VNSEMIAAWDKDWAVRFPRRLTRKQKVAFLDELTQALSCRGYETERIDVKTVGLTNRLLLTKCPKPKVIFMAHFDTPTQMPRWVGWVFRLFGHTRQILVMVLLLALVFVFQLFVALFRESSVFNIGSFLFLLAVLLSFIPSLIPNPSNREDNTSGVIGLMAIADWMKDDPQLRQHVQFVFLDNEELGLLGAMGLKRHWDRLRHPYPQALIINLDCVSRGEKPLVVYHNNDRVARQVLPFIQKQYPNAAQMDLRILPLSDNYVFKQEDAVNISLTDPSIIPGGYYIDKIHTPSDNDFSPEKLVRLLTGLAEFLSQEKFTVPEE
jgi:hypothetical protein